MLNLIRSCGISLWAGQGLWILKTIETSRKNERQLYQPLKVHRPQMSAVWGNDHPALLPALQCHQQLLPAAISPARLGHTAGMGSAHTAAPAHHACTSPKLGQREAPTAAPGGSAFLGHSASRNKPRGAAQVSGWGQGTMEVRQGQGQGTLFIRSVGTLRKTTCDCRHIRLLWVWNRSNNLRAK